MNELSFVDDLHGKIDYLRDLLENVSKSTLCDKDKKEFEDRAKLFINHMDNDINTIIGDIDRHGMSPERKIAELYSNICLFIANDKRHW